MKTPVKKDGKVVGVVENQTYYTNRDKKNIFRMYRSVNISEDILSDLEALDVKDVEVTYTNEGQETKYTVKLDKFLTGISYEYNGDKQRCVRLSQFNIVPEMKEIGLDQFLKKEKEVRKNV